MGSKSYSVSTAIDNRLAVTDQGFGLSSSGSGNNTALEGHIFNISGGGGQGYKGVGGASGGVNINLLDGGVIDKAFDFSAFSLSAMLDSVISGQKTQQAAAQYTADAIGGAVTQAASVNAAAAAAAVAANKELEGDKLASGKKLLVVLGLAGVGWYFWKGKK